MNKTSHICISCHAPISADEIALSKKMINRSSTQYYCISCLASAFEVTEDDLQKKIQYYKSIGCTLFHL